MGEIQKNRNKILIVINNLNNIIIWIRSNITNSNSTINNKMTIRNKMDNSNYLIHNKIKIIGYRNGWKPIIKYLQIRMILMKTNYLNNHKEYGLMTNKM